MQKKIYFILSIAVFQFGCAERYVYQNPAPVFRSPPPPKAEEIATPLKTYKYPETTEAEQVPKTEPEAPVEVEQTDSNPAPIPKIIVPAVPTNPVLTVEPTPIPGLEASAPPAVLEPAPAPPPPPPEPPLSMASFSPAILALATEADHNAQSGQYDSAVVKIERALRIDPRNAILTYKLAALKLKQEQPRLAEDLAKKAALLAGSDRDIKKRSWRLIAQSKQMQNDPEGALKAEQKAAQF